MKITLAYPPLLALPTEAVLPIQHYLLDSLDSLSSKLGYCSASQAVPFVAENTKLDSPLMLWCFEAALELTVNQIAVT